MTTPYIGFDNDQLDNCLPAKKGDLVECWKCRGTHPIEHGTCNGEEIDVLGFYRCGEALFVASVHGKLIVGVKPACSGSVSLDPDKVSGQ